MKNIFRIPHVGIQRIVLIISLIFTVLLCSNNPIQWWFHNTLYAAIPNDRYYLNLWNAYDVWWIASDVDFLLRYLSIWKMVYVNFTWSGFSLLSLLVLMLVIIFHVLIFIIIYLIFKFFVSGFIKNH